jgi:hypothetical protein
MRMPAMKCVAKFCFLLLLVLDMPVAFGQTEFADHASGCKLYGAASSDADGVSWSGACRNGYAQGKGAARWLSGSRELFRIEGTYVSGNPVGNVDIVYANGDRYHGGFKQGQPDGHGLFTSATFATGTGLRYEGGYKDGQYDGHGVLVQVGDGDRTRYEGQFKDGKRSGNGVEDSTGYHYQGQFEDDDMSGHGVKTWPNGMRYDGDFVGGEARGQGTWTWPNGSRYTGEVSEYNAEGHGVFIDAAGKRHEGQWHFDCLREDGGFVNVEGNPKLCSDIDKETGK